MGLRDRNAWGVHAARNKAGRKPDSQPNGTTDVELLLHSVVKPGFPSTRQLSGTLNFVCTTFVGNFVDGPSLPNEGQPPPPVGPAIWKGSAMFTVVNDEHIAN